MPRYLLKIYGRNFLLKFDGKWERNDFFTWRMVDAPDELLAQHTALEEFRASAKFRGRMAMALHSDGDPPELRVKELQEVGDDARFKSGAPPGLVFHPSAFREGTE